MGLISDVKSGNLYYSTGEIINEFCILVDGDVLASYGDYEDIYPKYELLIDCYDSLEIDSSSIKLLKITGKIDHLYCPQLIESLTERSACGVVERFTRMYEEGRAGDFLLDFDLYKVV